MLEVELPFYSAWIYSRHKFDYCCIKEAEVWNFSLKLVDRCIEGDRKVMSSMDY